MKVNFFIFWRKMKSFKKSFFLNTCAERMNIDTNSFKQNIFQQLLADTGTAIY